MPPCPRPLLPVFSVYFMHLAFLKRMDRNIIRLNIESTHFEEKQISCLLVVTSNCILQPLV